MLDQVCETGKELKLQKLRGVKEREQSEALHVLWCGCKVGGMGATPPGELEGSARATERALVHQVTGGGVSGKLQADPRRF